MHMVFIKSVMGFYLLNRFIKALYLKALRWSSVLLFAFIVSGYSAQADAENNYLRIENSSAFEKNDLQITSIGMIGLNDNKEGHVDLSFIESDEYGDALAIDGGGGYVFNEDGFVSFYLGLGVTLGYNSDDDDFISTFYPEAGIVLNFTKSFGMTISQKRYFKLYENTEDIIMLGLVFR